MSNCIAMKLWNLNLVPRAMPYKPWLRSWACVVAKHTMFFCLFVCLALFLDLPEIGPSPCPKQGICKNRHPHVANNTIATPNFIIDVCLAVACLATCLFANHFHVWSQSLDDTPSVLECQLPCFRRKLRVGLMEFLMFPCSLGMCL